MPIWWKLRYGLTTTGDKRVTQKVYDCWTNLRFPRKEDDDSLFFSIWTLKTVFFFSENEIQKLRLEWDESLLNSTQV